MNFRTFWTFADILWLFGDSVTLEWAVHYWFMPGIHRDVVATSPCHTTTQTLHRNSEILPICFANRIQYESNIWAALSAVEGKIEIQDRYRSVSNFRLLRMALIINNSFNHLLESHLITEIKLRCLLQNAVIVSSRPEMLIKN